MTFYRNYTIIIIENTKGRDIVAGEKVEELGFIYFRDHYDPNAKHFGGSNCNVSDIISPIYGNVEVKDARAQCGEFTENKINDNKFNKYIASKRREDVTAKEANDWCRNFYKEKGVNYFVACDKKGNFHLMTCDEFFDTHICTLQKREEKQNGSGSLPKIYYKYIPKEWDYQMINHEPTVLDKSLWDTIHYFTDKKGQLCRMSPTTEKQGQIRKLGRTKSVTWAFSVESME